MLLKKNGGVIGLCPWGPLCWNTAKKTRPTLDDYIDHIDYVVDKIGIEHVGFGCDNTLDDSKDLKGTKEQSLLYPEVVGEYDEFVGIDSEIRHAEGFKGVWEIDSVIEKLKERGYYTENINKFLGGNFLKVIKRVWRK
jgi:membrane dipeptidase